MFNSQGKQRVRANVSSTAVESGDSEHLSHNSRQRQKKINAQAAEIAQMKTELNKALQENQQLKSLFSPDKVVEAMTKVVGAMTMQSCPPSSSKGTQYQGASCFVGRPRPPQLACGADGTLSPSITCNYCKDTRHFKDNCVWLNNKLVHELAQEQVTKKASDKAGRNIVTKKIMAPQTLDQSDGEKVCGPDQRDNTILESKGIVGLMEKISSQQVSAQVKIEVMQRAMATCPKINMGCGRKVIPSLLDSGIQVTLICQSFFEQEILPHLKPADEEKAKAHQLFQLTAANDGKLPVSMYVELDLHFLGIVVPKVGVLITQEPNELLESCHKTKLPGMVGWNLVKLAYEVFVKNYGVLCLDNFDCPTG